VRAIALGKDRLETIGGELRMSGLKRLFAALELFFSPTLILLLLFVSATEVQAQLLYSYESDLEGWEVNTADSGISVATSTGGATLGLQSMEIETGESPTFSWDARVNEVTPGSANYDAFNVVAADLSNYTLDFDVTFTEDSFADVASVGQFFLVNVAVNSDEPNFPNITNVIGNVAPSGVPVLGTYQASIPMTQLPVAVDSSFYQINIGSNSVHSDGPLGEGVKYYIDNVRFTQEPNFTEDTLFSWETEDDPGTPEVDERFEGWTEGFHPGHTHSITTTGATDGSSALQIDRTSIPAGFAWGSQYRITSVIPPEPSDLEADFDEDIDVDGTDFLTWQRGNGTTSSAGLSDGDANGDEAVNGIDLGIWKSEFGNGASIDPVIQATIDDLASRIEGADKIAFDVTYDDPFPLNPTFTNFAVHFSDQTGVFYQKAAPNINIAAATEETTVTFELDLADFDAFNDPRNLAVDGFVEGTDFLRIGISTSTNDGSVYQIDNIRLLTEVPPAFSEALAAVPEPSAGLLACVGAMLILAGPGRASLGKSIRPVQ
jgi:hypothetical protein